MSLTDRDVLKVAQLALLDVPEAERTALAAQLDGIVAYVGQLADLPDAGADAPFVAGPERAALRSDEVRPIPLARPLAELAPELAEGFFVVPRLPAMEQG